MSLELKVEELADAIRGLTAAIKTQPPAVAEVVKETKATKVKVEKEVKPIVQEQVAAGVSRDQLFDKLKEHAAAFGMKTTKALMVKFGADANAPTTMNVPVNAYQKLFDSAIADLTKKDKPSEEVFA